MSAKRKMMIWCGGLLGLLLADAGPAQQAPGREGFRDKYGVVSERNIFMRERGRRRRYEGPSRPAYSPPVEDAYVLRGVVFEDDIYRAHIESLNTSTVLKLAVGEPVASGKVTAIDIDAIEYEQPGHRPIRIEVGQTLTGGQAVLPTISSEGSGSTTQPASAPAIDPNSPNLTLEQKMKLRRMQELNRK